MSEHELQAAPAELRMVVTITRKATGKVEEYVLVSIPEPEPEPKEES